MSGSIPFYQKHHRHYDRGYRSRETQSAISQYQQSSSTYSSHSSKSSKGIRAATYTALGEGGLSPQRAKPTYLAMDKENQIIGYVVPIFRGSHEFQSGLSDTEEARAKESAGYLARRDLFASGVESERIEHKSHRTVMRESAERISLSKRIHENEEYHKRLNEDSLMHTPEFVIKPRSHTVWEKQCVRLHCTISGWPEPRVVWYKNNVSIDPMAKPGKYKVESSYSVHSLEIDKCDFDDTAQYRVSAMNSKGETSAFASVVVKRFKGEVDESLPSPRLLPCLEYGVKFETHIVEKFGVSFGREGETLSFGCSVIIYPALQRFQPEIEWYRDDKLLVPSKWVQMHWSGDRATLTLSHLNKEDEGLYTLRVITKSGFETHSAYVFVRDADAEVAGAPGAPLDVQSLDANKDYVIVTWKQPAVDGGSPILGYFVDRCEVGTTHWSQCNDTPVKFARFPVTGLVEGRSYVFRVRAVNKAGMSHPSRVSEPVAAMDPADRTRKGPSAPWTGQIIVTEEEPVEGVVPGRPRDLSVIEATKNYVVLSWKPPGDKGHEGVMYYVEKCVSGTDSWQRVNTEIPVKSPRFALFDLAEGKSYRFRVRCCNSAGVGEPSEPTEATTVGDKLDIPSAPGRVVPTRNTDTSVVVSWEASRGAKELVGYYIESSIAGSNSWEPCNNKPVKCTRFICHGLTTDESYVFRVRAINAAGISEFSQESEAIKVKAAIGGGILHASPTPPYGITVLECVRDSMVLAWKQPTFIGGADITGYFVDYREVIGGVPGKWHEANIKAVSDRAYRVSELKENMLYQFQVRAANMAGVGIPSLPSETFKCEEWTIAVPGPPHDLQVQEVRKDSLVLLWKAPVYQGRDPVNGYYIDIKEADADFEMWRGVNEKATDKTFMKIKDLKEGESYVFRVRAQNKAGVGKASDPTEPVDAVTKPGTAEIVVNVDDDGVISLNFECSNLTADSKFVWSKNYMEMTEPERMTLETKGSKSKAIFKTPSEEDLGIYSCFVTHTDGASASYTLSEETLKDLLKISHEHKFPIIPLKTELAVELLEKGRVRFWLQAEKISANGKVEYVFNDNVIHQGEKYKMNFDKNTGVIEMFMESLGKEDEGTFTFQLQDGKATNQSSLVLIGDVFKQLQKESEFQKKEWIRKQGPHFVEYLGYEVTPECCVRLKCKVANMKKDSVALWYKDGREIKVNEKLDFSEGVLTLEITQISKKDAGIYEVVLKDDRGKDTSTLNLTDQGFKDLMNQVFSVIANSSTPLKIQSTEEGIRLYSFVSYYNDELHVTWHHKDAAIAFTERIKSGVVGEQLWLQISEPTEKDKGKYAIEFFDGKGGLRRTVELAGQAFDDAFAEFQRLKAAAIAERNRARVAGGLPDVVTIQEGKSLNLTCNISGDPVPEVTWLKNEREMVSNDHYILKFESGKFASFTITSVNTSDSGKYSILVKNKYGTESGDFTLNVIESMVDFGVMSYLADADGNVIVGPTTPVPTPSTRSVPTTPSPAAPTLTSTPANTNPQNKTRATPTLKNQTPRIERSSSPPAQIPINQSPGSPTPQNQTSDTLIPSTLNTSAPQPSTPTSGEKSASTSMDNEKITAMLKDSVDNLGLSTSETELVDAMHLTELEDTTSSEPDDSTPALETENLENVCETKDD
ncbi:M-protein, striated muscle isoform X3 [Carassius gibelio]|uniref:M-protein, striated muscle isoform X3 n=1 Tax=Carassius gibelio TaxID=101364 RepID=UPI002279D667|nr:M-protein, striated muscle isoform X3 [Carassius gibelio]